MQPINLLPPYIYDKQKKAALIGVWGAVAAIILIACVAYAGKITADINAAQAEKEQASNRANNWSTSDAAITKINQEIASDKSKLDFVKNAQKWNDAWPGLFEMMRDWTSNDILLKTMSLDPQAHQVITLTGFAQDERKIIQWWMLLRNNPHNTSRTHRVRFFFFFFFLATNAIYPLTNSNLPL
jgi:hypothetical protein